MSLAHLDPHMILVFVLVGLAVAVFVVCLLLEALRIDPVRLIKRLSWEPEPRRELTGPRAER